MSSVCTGPVAVRVGAERTDERVANSRLGEHLRNLADRPLVGGDRTQGSLQVGFPARVHETAPDRDVRSHARLA